MNIYKTSLILTHMWKTATAASVKLLACKFSPLSCPLAPSQVLTLTTHQRLDQTPAVNKVGQNIAQNSGLSTTSTAAMLLLEPQTDSSALASNCPTTLSCCFNNFLSIIFLTTSTGDIIHDVCRKFSYMCQLAGCNLCNLSLSKFMGAL